VLNNATFQGNINLVVGEAPENKVGEYTYFDGNPWVLVKQATAYALSYRTRYIALCDWDTLILIHFNQLSMLNTYGGDDIRTTIIRDQAQMRLALLGFPDMAAADQKP
jgi:hypothetical protein